MSSQNPNPLTVMLASTFTADYAVPCVSYWFNRLEVNAEVQVAPLDQLFQLLLSEGSEFGRNKQGINVALVRTSDWLKRQSSDADAQAVALEFTNAVKHGAGVAGGTLLLIFCPCDPSHSQSMLSKQLEDEVAAGLADAPGVSIIRSQTLLQDHGTSDIYDAQSERLAASPYGPTFYTTIGSRLARAVYAHSVPAHKVLVLDCDDTLWGGLCSELGHAGIKLNPEHLALQQFAVDQSKQGTLICLASRNNEADVLEVFARRSDMLLHTDHLTAWKIDWGMKSNNLAALAKELGLGLDSFVFIDDDPVQIAEVQSAHPGLLAIQTPATLNGTERLVNHLWPLDQRRSTQESVSRATAYRDHAAREKLRDSTPTLQSFLDSLELQIHISELSDDGILRAAELSQRTNQFNLSGARLTESELRHLLTQDNATAFTASVTDRFGDYGTVGLMLCRQSKQAFEIFGFYLSCRALGRGVEHNMLRYLGRQANQCRLPTLALTCIANNKNQPAQEFVRSLDAACDAQDEARWLLDAGDAAQAMPQYDQNRGHDAKQEATSAMIVGQSENRLLALAAAATKLADSQALHLEVNGSAQRSYEAAGEADDPVRSLLMEQFSSLLGIDEIDDDTGFFELGGHSLQAVQILATASNTFEIELDPTLLFTTNFSIAELCDEIGHLTATKGDYKGVAGLLDTISQMTD